MKKLSKKPNILYLSYDGMTDPLGQSQVLPYLRELSKKGYVFHLISFEKSVRYQKHKKEIELICLESGITWHPIMYTKNPPVISTMFDIRKMRTLALKLHRKHAFSIVHCRSYLSAIVGLRLKRTFGLKFLFDMRGFWADERVDGKIWNLKKRLYRTIYKYFKQKEKVFLNEADYVISLTYSGKDEIVKHLSPGINEEKIKVIPCCADLSLFDPGKVQLSEQDNLRKKLGIQPDDQILGYVGSIGTWYMLKEMLQLFKSMHIQNTSMRFLFLTGDPPERIRSEARSIGIKERELLIESCMHSEVPTYISLFDISVFFILPAYSKKASSPTKQGELMAMGIPLICNDGVGDTARVVNTYRSGIVLSDLGQFPLDICQRLRSSFDKTETMRGANEFYSLESGVESYATVYGHLIQNKLRGS